MIKFYRCNVFPFLLCRYVPLLIRFVSVSDVVSTDSNSDYKEVLNFLNMKNGFSQPLVPCNTSLYPPITYIDFPSVSERLSERNNSMFLYLIYSHFNNIFVCRIALKVSEKLVL